MMGCNSISKTVDNRKDIKLSWVVMYAFIANALNYTIKTALPIPESMRHALSVVIGLSIVFVYVLCIRDMMRRAQLQLLLSILTFGLLYAISLVLCDIRLEPTNLVMETARSTFLFYIPAGVLAVSVREKRVLYETMVKASFILSGFMYFVVMTRFLGWISTNKDELTYSMSLGYILIVPTIIHINEFLRTKKQLFLVLSLLDVIIIFLFASRGVLLSLFAFAFYRVLLKPTKLINKVIGIFAVLFIGIIFYANSERILFNVIGGLDSVGVDSRTLTMMANDELDDDSGRKHLFDISKEMIREEPLLGWGIGGECYHIAGALGHSEADVGHTSHNGVLQAMVQLGVVGGLIVSFMVIFPIFGLKRMEDEYKKSIIEVLYCSYALPAVTISSGFFVQPYIAMYLYLYYFDSKK